MLGRAYVVDPIIQHVDVHGAVGVLITNFPAAWSRLISSDAKNTGIFAALASMSWMASAVLPADGRAASTT